jgi:hypothetical protein
MAARIQLKNRNLWQLASRGWRQNEMIGRTLPVALVLTELMVIAMTQEKTQLFSYPEIQGVS